MPAETVTGEFCASYFASYKIAGSRGAVHTVTLSGGEGMPHCTCDAYKYAPVDDKDCKHLRRVHKEACLWNCQWHDGNDPILLRPEPEGIYGHVIHGEECPHCGGPVVAVRIAV